jgi:hypothetical protein
LSHARGAGRFEGDELICCLHAERSVVTFLPESEPERASAARALASGIAERLARSRRRALLIETLDGEPASSSPLAAHFREAGFSASAQGLLLRAAPVTAALSTPRRAE